MAQIDTGAPNLPATVVACGGAMGGLLGPASGDEVHVRTLGRNATVRRGADTPKRDISLAIRPGRFRLHPTPADIPLPATIVDLLYLWLDPRIRTGTQGAGR